MAEPPYGEIVDLLKKGQVVPFIGAGVNMSIRPPNARWDAKSAMFLPSGAELSRFLAQKSSFPSSEDHDLTDLPKVASYFVETSARRRLRERLHDIFNRDFDPCSIHTYLAEVATSAPLLMITTNYDDLLEQAFRRANCPFDLVIHPTDRKEVEAAVLWWRHGENEPIAISPNQLYIDLKNTNVIYKMHGTVDRVLQKWDSYVITEDDYVDFLARMTSQTAVPALFMHHCRTRNFLFLGYGLRDWNLRVLLRNLDSTLPITVDDAGDELHSWAIQYHPTEYEVELWNARQVKVYNMDINNFVEKLRGQ